MLRLQSMTTAAHRASWLRRRASLRSTSLVLLTNTENSKIAIAIGLDLAHRSRKPGGGDRECPACVICLLPILEGTLSLGQLYHVQSSQAISRTSRKRPLNEGRRWLVPNSHVF